MSAAHELRLAHTYRPIASHWKQDRHHQTVELDPSAQQRQLPNHGALPLDEGWEPQRIVVMRALHLGDLLCATPALRALRHRFPSAEITLIGLPWAENLVRRLSSIDRLVYFPGYPGMPEGDYHSNRTAAFLAEAREARYDLALQMHGAGDISNSFVAALGAQVSLGFRHVGDDRLTFSLPYVADDLEIVRWLQLVSLLGAKTDTCEIEFPITAAEGQRAAELLASAPKAGGPLVGLHPGGSTPLRRWPAERFAELADTLIERWDCRVVLTGHENERELTETVCRLARHPLLDLAGKTDLGTFAAVIDQLDFLITNDTGASHLAAASGTASVVIFGSTQPHQWAPLDRERHLVVDARTFAQPETSPIDALAQLPIEPVLLACERHLDNNPVSTAMPHWS